MRTAQICPTCATYTNAVCVIYDGIYLSNINVSPGDDLETILASVDSTIDVMLASFQPLLGFTPEDVANKSTSVIIDQASNTKYPSVKAVFDWVVANFTPVLGFTPENVANKSTNIVTDQASNTKYPSVKAVFDWATATFQPVLGFTPENVANKSTDNTLGGLTPSNTLYPTQKAVKDFVTTAIGAIDLQAVTDVGNSTTNEILHTSGSNGAIFSYNNGIQVYSLTNGGVKLGVDPVNKGYVSIGNGVGSAAALVKANNLTASRTHQLPNADGTLVLSVNGNTADAQGDVTISVSAPYLVYTALLDQDGTATVLQNTLGTTINWTNPSNGVMRGTAASGSPFTQDKTWISSGSYNNAGTPYFVTGQPRNLTPTQAIDLFFYLYDGTITGTPSFSNYSIEIRVYP